MIFFQVAQPNDGYLSFVALVLAGGSFLITLWNANRNRDQDKGNQETRIAHLEVKVDALWHLLFRGGVSEALSTGFLERKSPLRLSIQAIETHKDLLERIQSWYHCNGRSNLTDVELLVQLEMDFGIEFQKIVEESNFVFRPGALLVSALFECRPDSELFKKFDHENWTPKEESCGDNSSSN